MVKQYYTRLGVLVFPHLLPVPATIEKGDLRKQATSCQICRSLRVPPKIFYDEKLNGAFQPELSRFYGSRQAELKGIDYRGSVEFVLVGFS